MEISFSLELEDMIQYHVALQDAAISAVARREGIRRLFFWGSLMGAAALMVAIVYFNNQGRLVGPSLLPLAIAVLGICGFHFVRSALSHSPSTLKAAHEPYIRKAAMLGLIEGEYTPQTLRLSAEGLSQTGAKGAWVRSWSGIRSITNTGRGFILLIHGRAGYPIPLHAFASREEAYRFFDICKEQIATHQGNIDKAVVDFLVSNDVPCPRCKYELRGLEDSKCPECGLRLNLGMLRTLARDTTSPKAT